MADPDALALRSRTGIPDPLAPLRAAYPADQWRTHGGFGPLASFWLQVHAALRREAGEVGGILSAAKGGGIDRATLPGRLVPALNRFLSHLDAHHRIEDQAYFPKFRALDPRIAAGFDLLEADHHVIDESIQTVVASARRLLAVLPDRHDTGASALDDHAVAMTRLSALLVRHLADEEEIVIPAILEHGERRLG